MDLRFSSGRCPACGATYGTVTGPGLLVLYPWPAPLNCRASAGRLAQAPLSCPTLRDALALRDGRRTASSNRPETS